MNIKAADLPPSDIRIDKEGVWYYRGAEMFRKEIVNLFYQNLKRDESGGYYIELRNDIASIEVEDTAFVVRAVTHQGSETDGGERIVIALSDDTCEELSPDSLWIGDGHVLYCRVKGSTFPARFLRPSYYQMAEYFEQDEGQDGFYLSLNGRRYDIRESGRK